MEEPADRRLIAPGKNDSWEDSLFFIIDKSRGNSFRTYAEYRIRGAILDNLRAQDWVPRSVRDKNKKINDATRRLEAELGRAPTLLELADAMGLEVDDMNLMIFLVQSLKLVPETAAEGSQDNYLLEQQRDPLLGL